MAELLINLIFILNYFNLKQLLLSSYSLFVCHGFVLFEFERLPVHLILKNWGNEIVCTLCCSQHSRYIEGIEVLPSIFEKKHNIDPAIHTLPPRGCTIVQQCKTGPIWSQDSLVLVSTLNVLTSKYSLTWSLREWQNQWPLVHMGQICTSRLLEANAKAVCLFPSTASTPFQAHRLPRKATMWVVYISPWVYIQNDISSCRIPFTLEKEVTTSETKRKYKRDRSKKRERSLNCSGFRSPWYLKK